MAAGDNGSGHGERVRHPHCEDRGSAAAPGADRRARRKRASGTLPTIDVQGSGTSGVYANGTSVATKVDTPLIDIPQSLSVVTKQFILDQNFQNLTNVGRYVPGVAVHQGEGNRDELVIRGVD